MSFLKDSAQTFAVGFGLLFINLVGGVITARWLGPGGVGLLALVGLLHQFAFRSANLGFGSSYAFFIAKGKATSRNALRSALILSVAMSLVSCFGLVLVRAEDFSPWQGMPSDVFNIGLLLILPVFLEYYMQRILSGQLKIQVVNISVIVNSIFQLSLLVLFVVILEWGIAGALYSLILAKVAVVGYLFVNLIRTELEDDVLAREPGQVKMFFEMWRYGRWNYLIMFLNFFLEQIPLVILSVVAGKDQIGLFSTGRGLAHRFRMLPDSFAKVLFPYTAASGGAEATRRTNILCRNFVVISGACGAAFAIVIEPLISLIYGEDFTPAANVFYAMIPAIIFWPLSQFLTVHIAALGDPKGIFWYRLAALPGSLAISWLLIPTHGIVGAAASLSATYMLVALVCLVAYVRVTKSRIVEVLLPQPEDLEFYRKILDKLPIGSRS